MALKVFVEVYASVKAYEDGAEPIREYLIDHDDESHRRVLGEQCRNVFEAGQLILTYSDGRRKGRK